MAGDSPCHNRVFNARLCARGHQPLLPVAARVCEPVSASTLAPSFRYTGCIPVFLLEGEAMPFEETVDWSNSAVRVRREISIS